MVRFGSFVYIGQKETIKVIISVGIVIHAQIRLKVVGVIEMNFKIFETKEPIYPKPYRSAKEVYDSLKDYSKADKEMLIVMPLNSAGMILDCFIVHLGTANSSNVSTRDIFRACISVGATHLIVAHNHPSGDCEPSRGDDLITETIVKAGQLLDIKVLDHVIIGKECFYSYGDNGKIDEIELTSGGNL